MPGSLARNDKSEQKELRTAVAKTSTVARSKGPEDQSGADDSRHSRLPEACYHKSVLDIPGSPLPRNLCLSLTPWVEIYLVSISVLLLISCCPWRSYFTPLKLRFSLL